MNRTARRTVTLLMAAPAVATLVFAAASPASANAAPGDPTTCTTMAMPQTTAGNVNAPNMLTRAGQLGMTAPAADSDPAMGSGCTAASHG